MEHLELGPAPAAEPCQQLGKTYNPDAAKLERKAYIKQLERMFDKEMETGIYFRSKGFPHEFGTYYEVCVIYNENDEDQTAAAYHVENNIPEDWDEQAKIQLELGNMPRFNVN